MKINIIVLLIIILTSCSEFIENLDGGTLGSASDVDLECSESDVSSDLQYLLTMNKFKVNDSDSTVVNRWKQWGYDFLNYTCINLDSKLYMITINKKNENESIISIRAYYDRKINDWVFASDFTNLDLREAERAMKKLVKVVCY